MAPKNQKPESDNSFMDIEPKLVSFRVVGNCRLSNSGKAINIVLTARPAKNMSIPLTDIKAIVEGKPHVGAVRVYNEREDNNVTKTD